MGGKKGNKSKKSKTKKEKTAVQKAAEARHAKFKQTRVQTFGGKKTSFSDAEKKRITYAGYSVAGYSKAAPNSGATSETDKQVARDNAMYGNTFPSGGIGFSEEGKAQAEAQKSVQGNFMPSNPVYQGVGAYSGVRRYRDSDYLTAAPYVNAFQQTFGPNATLKGNRFNPADRAAALGAGYLDAGAGLINAFKNMGPQGLLGFGKKIPNVPTLPKFENENLQKLRNFGSVVIPGLQTFGAANRLAKVGLGQEVGQMTLSNAAYNAGVRPALTKTGITGVNPLTIAKAFTPGMLKTGPTAGGSAAILGTATGLSAAQQAKANETQTGGLNIGGGVDSGDDSGDAKGSKTGRVLNDIGDAINTYKGIFNDVSAIRNAVAPKPQFATFREDAAEQAALNKASTPLSIDSKDVRSDIKSLFGTGMNYKDVANTVSDARAVVEGGAEGFKNLSASDQQNLVKSAGGIIDNSKVFESLGKQYTGSDTFKDQTQGTLAAVNKTLKEASQDTKGRVDPINNLLANFNKTPGYETASKYLKTLENPNLTTRQRIQAAYDPTSPKVEALSKEDRGIVGSAGNLLIGGKLSDVFRANNPTERGTTFTPTDSANLIANTMIAANTPGSLTQQRFSEIGALTGQGTKVTPGSLIKGVLPRLGRGTNNTLRSSTGSSPTTLAEATPTSVEEILLLPTTTAQGGTNATDLAQIQQQAYNNQLSIYGMNPNYFAQFRQPKFNTRPIKFRQQFNRDYY